MTLTVAVGDTGSPIALLHGFPQTHLMWRFERNNMDAAVSWIRRLLRVLDGDVLDGFGVAFPTDAFGEYQRG